MRFLLWPVCALFRHEAIGLLGEWAFDRDVRYCGCGRRVFTGAALAIGAPVVGGYRGAA